MKGVAKVDIRNLNRRLYEVDWFKTTQEVAYKIKRVAEVDDDQLKIVIKVNQLKISKIKRVVDDDQWKTIIEVDRSKTMQKVTHGLTRLFCSQI